MDCKHKIRVGESKFCSNGDVGVNYNELLTSDINKTSSKDTFTKTLTSELIDVKNRQTIQSYPTLRLLYDRYLNSEKYGCDKSKKYNYNLLEEFGSLVGDFWVDLIEQVVPSTALWGSTFVYRNTEFDRHKFQYKPYNLWVCDEPNGFTTMEIENQDELEEVEAIIYNLKDVSSNEIKCFEVEEKAANVCTNPKVTKINNTNEYFGTITITDVTSPTNGGDTNIIYSSL